MNLIKRYQRIILLVLLVLIIISLWPRLSRLTVTEILTYTPEYPLLAAAALLALYSLKALVCAIPMTVLYISAGVVLPVGWAIAITYAGLICEITIGYWMGGYMSREQITELANRNEKAAKFVRYMDRHSNVVVFIVRMVPGPLPFDIMSWLFGASKMNFASYLLYSLLGVSPAMIPWVLAGKSITNPLSKEFLLPFLICAVIAVTILLALLFLEKKHTPSE